MTLVLPADLADRGRLPRHRRALHAGGGAHARVRGPAIAAAFGCTLGIVPHMTAAMLGLAAVLHTSALAFAALKWCGVLYLLYMAWQALRETGALAIDPRPAPGRSSRRVIVTGFLINILNPKLSIFFLAFLPQFIAADEASPAGADAGIERGLHGDDVCGVRGLRPVRGRCPRPRHHQAQGDDLAAPELCRRALPRSGASWRLRNGDCADGAGESSAAESKRRTRGPPFSKSHSP